MAKSPAEEFALLRESVVEMRQTLDERLAQDPIREAAMARLYEELKLYRDNFVAEAEKPLLLDLLLLFDSFHWFHQALVKQEMSPEVIADSFQFLVDELLEILYRRDVTPMESRDAFDRTLHRAVQTMPAATPDEDNRVSRVLKRGFMRGGQVLRPEEVVVAKYKGAP